MTRVYDFLEHSHYEISFRLDDLVWVSLLYHTNLIFVTKHHEIAIDVDPDDVEYVREAVKHLKKEWREYVKRE